MLSLTFCPRFVSGAKMRRTLLDAPRAAFLQRPWGATFEQHSDFVAKLVKASDCYLDLLQELVRDLDREIESSNLSEIVSFSILLQYAETTGSGGLFEAGCRPLEVPFPMWLLSE